MRGDRESEGNLVSYEIGVTVPFLYFEIQVGKEESKQK